MKRQFATCCTILALLGAGCTQPTMQTTTSTVDEIGTPSPEGFVTFREGFGPIPGNVPLPPVRTNNTPVVRWDGNLPYIPTEVTVIRRHRTLPEAAFLQNITSALGVPAGALRYEPNAESLRIVWTDDVGYRWTYDATLARLTFERINAPKNTVIASIPNDEELLLAARSFLEERGVLQRAWVMPTLAFSWNAWWSDKEMTNRCMTQSSINAIRKLADNPYANAGQIPQLPVKDAVSCTAPEFPTRQVVRFALSQDEQLVYDSAGSPSVAAEVVVRANDLSVDKGSVEFVKEADRSNYPTISPEELIERLRAGGLHGTADVPLGAQIVLKIFENALYRHDASANGEIRTYFIPAIRASGSVVMQDGTEEAYETIVPLAADNQYGQ